MHTACNTAQIALGRTHRLLGLPSSGGGGSFSLSQSLTPPAGGGGGFPRSELPPLGLPSSLPPSCRRSLLLCRRGGLPPPWRASGERCRLPPYRRTSRPGLSSRRMQDAQLKCVPTVVCSMPIDDAPQHNKRKG